MRETKLIRGLLASVLWILSGLLGLVGILLCVTVILLPVGIPVLMLARRLFAFAMTLLLPRKVRHPADELGKAVRDKVPTDKGDLKHTKKKARKVLKKGRKRLHLA